MGKDRYRGFEDEKTDDEVSRMFEREGRAEQESKKSVGQPKNPKHLQQQAAKEEKYFPPAVAKHDAKKEVWRERNEQIAAGQAEVGKQRSEGQERQEYKQEHHYEDSHSKKQGPRATFLKK